MNGYTVWHKVYGGWFTSSDDKKVNLMYAEVVRDYYLGRGIPAVIREYTDNGAAEKDYLDRTM